MTRPVALRLLRDYDIPLLQRDSAALDSAKWAPVTLYNALAEGGSSAPIRPKGEGVALYGKGGAADSMSPGMSMQPYAPTELLACTPYFREVLDGLECEKLSVRLLALYPEGVIGTHFDEYLGFGFGQVRFHIPIVDHVDAVFTVGSERVPWRDGELWWCDFAVPHQAYQGSSLRRVHMVLDVAVNEFVLSLFPPPFIEELQRRDLVTMPVPVVPMAESDLRHFECEFTVPRNVLPGADFEIPGSLRMIEGRLTVCAAGRPIAGLDPVGPTRFAPIGMARATIFFDAELADGAVTRLAVTRPREHTDFRHPERFELPLKQTTRSAAPA